MYRHHRLGLIGAALACLTFVMEWGNAEGGPFRCRHRRGQSSCECICEIQSLYPDCCGANLEAPALGMQGLVSPRSLAASSLSAPFPKLEKPPPEEITFHGCKPEGDGGDAILNRRKNRVDAFQHWTVLPFQTVARLPYPRTVNRKDRTDWVAAESAIIAPYEGSPIAVEGYLAAVKQESIEHCNCSATAADRVDYHIWLTETEGEGKSTSMVVEATPRIREKHPAWNKAAIQQLVDNGDRVRISGWLMFDQEHFEQLGRYRSTLWEIHPILQIEVLRNGTWVTLDDLDKNAGTRRVLLRHPENDDSITFVEHRQRLKGAGRSK